MQGRACQRGRQCAFCVAVKSRKLRGNKRIAAAKAKSHEPHPDNAVQACINHVCVRAPSRRRSDRFGLQAGLVCIKREMLSGSGGGKCMEE
jgi:hypothetical protein